MIIFVIVLIWLFAAWLAGRKSPLNALPFLISLLLLIPNMVKINLGVNMNVFNLSVFLFFFLSRKYLKRKAENIPHFSVTVKRYWIYIVVTSLLTYAISYPISEYIQNMLLFTLEYVILGYCLNSVSLDKKAIRNFDIALIMSTLVIIAYGVINYVTKVNVYIAYLTALLDLDLDMANSFMNEQRGFLDGRISSTFIHPLQLGQVSLLIFSYLIYEIKNHNFILKAILYIGLFAMCVLCGSRSAIFPIVLAAGLYVISMRPTKIFLYSLLVIVIAMAGFSRLPKDAKNTLVAMVCVWNEKASVKADVHGSSISGRNDQLTAAFRIVKDDFILGKGKGYVTKHGGDHSEMYGYESVVLKEIVDGGVVGLTAFTIFYFSTYSVLLRTQKKRSDKMRVHVLCLPFFLSAMLTGIAYSFFAIYMIFYFMTYFSLRSSTEEKKCLNENCSC